MTENDDVSGDIGLWSFADEKLYRTVRSLARGEAICRDRLWAVWLDQLIFLKPEHLPSDLGAELESIQNEIRRRGRFMISRSAARIADRLFDLWEALAERA